MDFNGNHFEDAVDAVVNGEVERLGVMLAQEPGLVRARSARPHRATLLHYVGANGVEHDRQKSPGNAVEVARLLLDRGAEVDAVAQIYGQSKTLGLVASSVHPRRAGVQIPLLETLIQYGAALEGVLPALRNGHRAAAEFLAGRGERLGMEGAAGLGRLDLVESLRGQASKEEMRAGFLWACEYGRINVMKFLIQQGVDLNAGLHWAVVGGSLEAVRLLLDNGADAGSLNQYGGTALDQALWCASQPDAEIDYAPVVELLRSCAKSG